MTKTLRSIIVTWLVASAATGVCFSQNPQPQSRELIESQDLNSSVMKLYSEGKYDEALPLAKRAVELREKALGASHHDLIPLLLNLGELYRVKQKLGEARSTYERALQLSEKAFGPEDLKVAKVLDKLAYLNYEYETDRKAEEFLARSLAIKEKAFGADSPDLFKTAFDLAEAYRLRGDYVRAELLYQRIIRIREKIGNKEDSQLLEALQSYVAVLFAQIKTDEAALVQKQITELLGEKRIVEGGVLNGKALKLVQPPYPPMARRVGASGLVYVRILIDETGRVIQAKVINPGGVHMSLAAASEEAALHSVFTPTIVSGKACKVYGTIIYRFVAQ